MAAKNKLLYFGMKISEKMEKLQHIKENKLDEQRREKIGTELADCTFHPKIRVYREGCFDPVSINKYRHIIITS